MRNLDVTAAGGNALPARGIDGPILYTDAEVWWYAKLTPTHLDYLTAGQRDGVAADASVTWAGLVGREVHVTTVVGTENPLDWAAKLADRAWRPQDDWPAWQRMSVEAVAGRRFKTKTTYVGVKLGDRRAPLFGKRAAKLLGELDVRAGTVDPMITGEELERWRREAVKVCRPLMAGTMGAEPCTGDEVARLIAHSTLRSHDIPIPTGGDRWGPGEIVGLTEGRLVRGPNYVKAVGPFGRETYHAVLTTARIPDPLVWNDGPPWLCLPEWVDGLVEVSARWEVIDWRRASKDVRKRIAAARDTERSAADAGAPASEQDARILASATELEAKLEERHEALGYAHTRFVCTADTAGALDELVEDVTEHYRSEADISLARPALDQLPLVREAMPGGKVEVPSYRTQHDIDAFGMGLPHATSGVGDGNGPYFGWTTGELMVRPVMLDPWECVRRKESQKATTFVVTGTLGAGKTASIMRVVRDAQENGARIVAVDPKGDLARLAGLSGDVDVIDLNDAPDGILDPWQLIDTPDAAKMVALEVINRLMPVQTGPQTLAILKAVKAEAAGPDPSLAGVLVKLSEGSDEAREVFEMLDMASDLPFARLAFRRRGAEAFKLGDGLTVITTPGIELPTAGTALTSMSWAERLAFTAMYLVGTYARRVALHAEPDRPKLIVMDEAWVLTATDQGRKLIDECSRMGRSRKLVLLMASQSAVDFADPKVRTCISTVVAHRIGSHDEGEAVAKLLDIAPSETLGVDLFHLQTGEAIVRDLFGNVARVKVSLEHDLALAKLLDHHRSETEKVPA